VPGEIYELEIQAKAEALGRAFRLQINWIAADGNTCDVFIRAVAAAPSWRSYTGRITAPERAERGEVYVTGHGGGPVWLDSLLFETPVIEALPRLVRKWRQRQSHPAWFFARIPTLSPLVLALEQRQLVGTLAAMPKRMFSW
jgi:hypothetical protein